MPATKASAKATTICGSASAPAPVSATAVSQRADADEQPEPDAPGEQQADAAEGDHLPQGRTVSDAQHAGGQWREDARMEQRHEQRNGEQAPGSQRPLVLPEGEEQRRRQQSAGDSEDLLVDHRGGDAVGLEALADAHPEPAGEHEDVAGKVARQHRPPPRRQRPGAVRCADHRRRGSPTRAGR